MKFSYYPGCTLKTKAKELDAFGRLSAAKLGVELEEIENWQCCGAVYPQAEDEIATKLSAVRALDAAKQSSQELLTLCSACHHVIKRVNADMRDSDYIRTRANNYLKLDEPYAGETNVIHYLEMLRDRVGFDNLKKAVVNPLKGRKIAAYYGCLLLRPSQTMRMDDPENPTVMEELLRALGAEPVVYPYRNECCGGYVSLENPALTAKKSGAVLSSAAGMGAQEIVTACPLCRYNLEKNGGGQLPVVYLTEILAEALGVKEDAQ